VKKSVKDLEEEKNKIFLLEISSQIFFSKILKNKFLGKKLKFFFLINFSIKGSDSTNMSIEYSKKI